MKLIVQKSKVKSNDARSDDVNRLRVGSKIRCGAALQLFLCAL